MRGMMEPTRLWVEQVADQVEQFVQGKKDHADKLVCASGISPSGPIHLGNLREAITVHFVTEELKKRGWNAEHIHSWDDFDRLRKVPANVPADFAANIGKPLADIPDPHGDYPSYAERFMREFETSMLDLGIQPRYIAQSQAYRRGDYNELIRSALAQRLQIFDILSAYQTLGRFEKDVDERREEYYPIRVYCEQCGKDDTTVTGYDAQTDTITYTCQNGHGQQSFRLAEKVLCKLVWKVDWPMRWRYEGVVFEPGGEDHSAPGSSYTVGKDIARLFDYEAPYFIPYGFVGMAGRSKMSSSIGSSATPRAALDILEPPMIRWLYVRKNPTQKFNIDFGQEVLRLYDEWDTFVAKVHNGQSSPVERSILDFCLSTSVGQVHHSQTPVSFRLLSSAADITQGNVEQITRIAADQMQRESGEQFRQEMEPRLTCAINWATRYVPEDERTHIRESFAPDVYAALDDGTRQGLDLLLAGLSSSWTLEGLTKLIYSIPKVQLGLPPDAAPTAEVKVAQRQFFKAVYELICSSETGPRIPTLFLSLGEEKVRSLLKHS